MWLGAAISRNNTNFRQDYAIIVRISGVKLWLSQDAGLYNVTYPIGYSVLVLFLLWACLENGSYTLLKYILYRSC